MGEDGSRVAYLTGLTVTIAMLSLALFFAARQGAAPEGGKVAVAESGFSILPGPRVTYAFVLENPRRAEVLEGAGYEVQFLSTTGRVVGSLRDMLPLVFPGKSVAVAGSSLALEGPASSMRVLVTGGVFTPTGGIAAMEPAQLTSLSGSLATAVVTNSYDFPLERLYVTAVFRDRDGHIISGASTLTGPLGPGDSQDVQLPSELHLGPDAHPSLIKFYAAPWDTPMADLVAASATAAAAPTPSPPRVAWLPAAIPPSPSEASSPFSGRAADPTWQAIVGRASGQFDVVLDASHPLFANWPAASADPALGFVSQSVTGSGLEGMTRIDLKGLDSTSLDTDISFTFAPAPDGRSVAISKSVPGGPLYVVSSSGETRQLTGIEGNLLLLDWSPDSTHLALAQLTRALSPARARGNVYIVSLVDGEAIVAARNVELQAYARWSPDSQKLAVVSRSGVVSVFDMKRGPLPLESSQTNGHQISWSDDSRRVAAGIGVWDVAGGRRLVEGETGLGITGSEISPDGNRLVYTEDILNPDSGLRCPGPRLQNRTHIVSVNSGDDRVLLDCEKGFHYVATAPQTPTVWIDNSSVVLPRPSCWGCEGGIVEVDLVDVETGSMSVLALDEDGPFLGFAVSRQGGAVAVSGESLKVFSSGGAPILDFRPPPGKIVGSAAWSPDGSLLLAVLAPADFRFYV